MSKERLVYPERGPLMALMVKRSVDQDYARLREILEQ
jgi:hypothetical protein